MLNCFIFIFVNIAILYTYKDEKKYPKVTKVMDFKSEIYFKSPSATLSASFSLYMLKCTKYKYTENVCVFKFMFNLNLHRIIYFSLCTSTFKYQIN